MIDLESIAVPREEVAESIVLQDGDRLFVPTYTQEVTVIGEIQYATSHLYNPAFGRDNYIQSSGGLTAKADKKRIYVVRANGAVWAGRSSRWFGRSEELAIRPGDTIVVPGLCAGG